ncbi:MAG: efflux RND transporter periplasmic adaptor subunit [Phycisphaerae bacterium]|nr:efflux RND transporter periplasmic adaptor subunit [Phycisphaerae bacterium]
MRVLLGVLVALIFILAAVVVIAGPDVSKWFPSTSSPTNGTKVRIEKAAIQPLVETISAPGEIIPNVKVDISAEVSARIVELFVRENQMVKKGETLVRLDDRRIVAAMQSAMARRDGEKHRLDGEMARIKGPQSALANAKLFLERQRSLFESGDIAKQALDDAEARVRDLEATVNATQHNISVIESSLAAAEADISQAKEEVGKTVIIAPMDGVITALNAELGELVMIGTMNNAGTVIMTIGDLSKVKMNAKVNEADIARVEPDQIAHVRINAYRDEVFEGRVLKVPLQRTNDLLSGGGGGSGYFKVEIAIEPKEGRQILSGLACNVDIEIKTHEGLAVPSQAVLDKNVDDVPSDIAQSNPLVDRQRRTTSVVFRVVDGKATLTPVKTGASNLTSTLIVAGIQAGDEIITGPYKVLEKVKHAEAVVDEAKDATKEKPAEDAASQTSAVAATH